VEEEDDKVDTVLRRATSRESLRERKGIIAGFEIPMDHVEAATTRSQVCDYCRRRSLLSISDSLHVRRRVNPELKKSE
jgi:hypothetical protein